MVVVYFFPVNNINFSFLSICLPSPCCKQKTCLPSYRQYILIDSGIVNQLPILLCCNYLLTVKNKNYIFPMFYLGIARSLECYKCNESWSATLCFKRSRIETCQYGPASVCMAIDASVTNLKGEKSILFVRQDQCCMQ